MNKHSLYVLLLFLWGSLCLDLQAISLVYNLKIRRSFTTSAALGGNQNLKWVATAVPIAYSRKRHIQDLPRGIDSREKRLTVGSLFNIRYHPNNHWWAEASTGLENEFLKSEGTLDVNISRFGVDDLVLSAGYNFFPKGNTQVVIYGLTGFPLNQKLTIEDVQDPLVGTRFYSFGVGSEISYALIQSLPKSLSVFFQNRFLRFFRRTFEPILPVGAKLDPGNVIDILFAARYRFLFNILEVGYNPTFFTDQAVILSAFAKIKAENSVRHGWYSTYSRGFKRIPGVQKPGLVGVGLSVSTQKRFKTKIVSGWLNFTVLF